MKRQPTVELLKKVRKHGFVSPYNWQMFIGPVIIVYNVITFIIMMISISGYPFMAIALLVIYLALNISTAYFWLTTTWSDPTDAIVYEC